MNPNLKDRVGTIGINNFGSTMEVVKYNTSQDIFVKFIEDGYQVHTKWSNFVRGKVANPYDKTVNGIGYMGEGIYKTMKEGKITPQYSAWFNLLQRCYRGEYLNRYPTYKDCAVCEQWHNFQNFAAWYDQNHYQVNEERMHLDKDILIKGNKVYSPETCVFVPQRINKLFVKRDASRGELPIGVSLCKRINKFEAHCKTEKNKQEFLGYHDKPEDAFYAYKKFKEQVIKRFAEEYKVSIPENLYEAMMKYEVEIED